MQISVAGYSDPGSHRERNDDCYCIGPFVEQQHATSFTTEATSRFFSEYGLLAVVADGLGGYTGGAVASRVVLETLSAQFYGERHDGCTAQELVACLEGYFAQTGRVLARVLSGSPELADAGTTIAGIVALAPDLLVVFHAGDSRVLRAAAGYVRPLTVDHTPIGMDVATGRLGEEEAATLPGSGSLTRSLGLRGDTAIEIAAHHWTDGDQVLIGTDGWHGLGRGLSRTDIQRRVREGGAPAALVRTLVGEAISQDGRDNASLVVVAFGGSDTAHGR